MRGLCQYGCGVDASATCPRCRRRYCAHHYVFNYSMNSDGKSGLMYTPAGTFFASFHQPEAYIDAVISGGPACMRCREVAGNRALSLFIRQEDEALTSLTDEFLARKDQASLTAVLAALWKGTASIEVYPTILPFMDKVIDAVGTSEVLTLELTPHPRRGKRWFHVEEPVVRVSGRIAAIPEHDGWITCIGEFYCSRSHSLGVPPVAQTAQIVVERGTQAPRAVYNPPRYGPDLNSPPYWSIGNEVQRQPFPRRESAHPEL
jgi:hypothetical protein